MDGSVKTDHGIVSNSWIVPRSNGSKGGAWEPEGGREGGPWSDLTPTRVTQSRASTI